MKSLDSKKIFEIFDKHPLDDIEENLNSYKSSFKFKIEMFTKVVVYGDVWKKQVISLFDTSTMDLDLDEINSVGDFMLYTRAWYWINQLEMDDVECVKSIKELSSASFLASLLRSITYFEGKEEFERCAFLVSIKNLLK